MKSLKKVAKENPTSTVATVIAALIGLITLFIDRAEFLGIDTEIVQWVSFGAAVLTTVATYFDSNPTEDNS